MVIVGKHAADLRDVFEFAVVRSIVTLGGRTGRAVRGELYVALKRAHRIPHYAIAVYAATAATRAAATHATAAARERYGLRRGSWRSGRSVCSAIS